ncbi:hypothetical protein GCM10027416_20130 [Okibacterium endophyticum]
MKNVLWLVAGIAAGFVVAHEVNKTAKGQRFFADLDGRLREFNESVADAYRAREAELRENIDQIVDSAEDTIDHLKNS